MTDAASEWSTLLGPQDDDLSAVLRHVRVNRLPATRRTWANSWQTREFLNLGLLILHRHQIQQSALPPGSGLRLSGALSPENLANTAQTTVADPDRAAALSGVRWKETWGHQAAFAEDLIGYLFRPAPFHRRAERLRGAAIVTDPAVTFARLVSESTEAILRSAAADPLIGLQAWVQAAVPRHPAMLAHARDIEAASRELWTLLLGRVLDAYELHPGHGITTEDLAVMMRGTMSGLLVVHRSDGRTPLLRAGGSMTAAAGLGWISAFCDVPLEDLEQRLPRV